MPWAKYDVTIDDVNFRSTGKVFVLRELKNLEILKESTKSWIPMVCYGLSAALALVCVLRFQKMPYQTGMEPFTNLKFVILLGLGSIVAFLYGQQRASRAPEITYKLNGRTAFGTVNLYSHSDEKIVNEIKAALMKALGKRKG